MRRSATLTRSCRTRTTTVRAPTTRAMISPAVDRAPPSPRASVRSLRVRPRTTGSYTLRREWHVRRWQRGAVQLRPAQLFPASERALHRRHVPQLRVERKGRGVWRVHVPQGPLCSRRSRPRVCSRSTTTVSCSNPLWTAAQFTAFCGQFGLTAADDTRIRFNRRNIEGGGRQQDLNHQAYRGGIGLKGTLSEAWQYDGIPVPGHVAHFEHLPERLLDRPLRPRAERRGRRWRADLPIRRRRSDPNCIPYNIWAAGGVTRPRSTTCRSRWYRWVK